jgi:hypothetical protein
MPIITVLVVLVVVGFLLWAANTYIPMDGSYPVATERIRSVQPSSR